MKCAQYNHFLFCLWPVIIIHETYGENKVYKVKSRNRMAVSATFVLLITKGDHISVLLRCGIYLFMAPESGGDNWDGP